MNAKEKGPILRTAVIISTELLRLVVRGDSLVAFFHDCLEI